MIESNISHTGHREKDRRLQERFRAFENSAEGLWMFEAKEPVPVSAPPEEIIEYWRRNSWLTECNDNMARMYGFEKAGDLVGFVLDDMMDFSDRDQVENLKEFIRNGFQSKYVETKEFDRYGNTKYFLNSMVGIVEDGMVKRIWGTQQDITEQRLAQQQLKQSELFYRNLIANVTDVIITTDLDRVVTSWNKVMEKMSGITEAEAKGKLCRHAIDADYSPYTHDQVAEIVFKEGIWKGEVSFPGHDGEKKYLLHTVSLLQNEKGESIGLLGVGKDITERKKIEARLQQSETFYRTLAANSLDGILMTDEKGKITYCGPSVYKISGHELHELLGQSIFDFVHPDDNQLAMQSFLNEIHNKTLTNYIVIRLRHAQRGWIWCTVRGHSLLHDPALNAIVIYFTDDTKRNEIEDRLRESETKFRTLINSLSQGVVLQNEKSDVILFNPAALSILGVTAEQLSTANSFQPRWKAVYEDGRECPSTEHPVPLAIYTKKPVKDLVLGVSNKKTGERVWLLISAEPIFDGEGNIVYVICSFTDITEQKKLSIQLVEQEVQRQRLLTQATIDGQEKERQEIGKELHDNINQHLTTTRLYLEVAREKAAGEVLEMITLAHKNLADIVNEIRQLSQSLVPPTLGDLGLVESVFELSDSLKRAHSFHVDFLHRHFMEETLPDNLKLMLFRIIQEQVNNIIRHANATSMQIKLQSDAEYIILSISDNGKGFDPGNYKKGMGFSNISNRAGLFDGKAEIDTAPGKGCIVTVTIPKP